MLYYKSMLVSLVTPLLNKISYLMLDFDVFMQHAAQFVVVSIPLKRLLSALLEEPFPVLCGAELICSPR